MLEDDEHAVARDDLDSIRGDGREMDCQYIMSNDFTFSDINTLIIFKKYA